MVTNVGVYDPRAGRWRPSTSGEDLAAQTFRGQQRRRSLGDFLKGSAIGTAAVIGGPLALSAVGGAGGAALPSASSGIGTSSGYRSLFGGLPAAAGGGVREVAPVGQGFSIGNFLKHPLTGMGVEGFMSWLANRSQNKANKYAVDSQSATLAEQTKMELAQQAEQTRQFNVQQAALKAQQDADNEMKRRTLTADEQDRAYTRGISEKREAYLQPFRDQAAQHRYTLIQMLGRG